MKNESNGKQSTSKEELRKMRQSLSSPPQLTMDPEKRRDFFNRLLEKYSTKSAKVVSQTSGSGFGARTSRFPTVPSSKVPSKIKDKFLKKKKSYSEKSIVKSSVAEDNSELDPMEAWKNSVRNHVFDTSVYKSHTRIKSRFPCPMPTIVEVPEPDSSSEGSDSEGTKSGETKSFESVSHSFTLLPSGDQKHRKSNRKLAVKDKTENESKSRKDLRGLEDTKSSGEGEERPALKKSGKIKRAKIKKNSLAQEFEENVKATKQTLSETKSIKPSSSSLPQLQSHQSQEDIKNTKKLNEKVKKPKKLTKKQTFTVVTTKPSS